MGKAREWSFQGWTVRKDGKRTHHQLVHLAQIPIKRHIKVRGDANPYDPSYVEYFEKRSNKTTR